MRRRSLLATLGSLAVTATAGCAAIGDTGDDSDQRTVASQLQGTPTVPDAVAWSAPVGPVERTRPTPRELLVTVRLEGGQRLIVFDREDGTRRWQESFDSRVITRLVDGRILVFGIGETGFTAVYRRDDGERLWRVEGFAGTRFGTDRIVVLESWNSDRELLSARRLDTGAELWRSDPGTLVLGDARDRILYATREDGTRITARFADGERAWTLDAPRAFGDAQARPIGDLVVLLSAAGDLLGVSAADGSVRFRDSLHRDNTVGGVVGSDRIYLGDGFARRDSRPARAAAVGADGVTWTRRIEGDTYRPFGVDEVVYGLADGERRSLLALDPATGETRWEIDGEPVAASARTQFLVRDGRLEAIAPDGSVRWRTEFPTTADDVEGYWRRDPEGTFVTARDGVVVSISQDGITSFDAREGTTRTRLTALGGVPDTDGVVPLAVDGERLYVPRERRLYAVQL